MANVAISGDTSGAVTLTVPSTVGTQTVTFPAATGTAMVSGNMPAFSAYKSGGSGSQSITGGVVTKVTYDTKEFDTNNCFASSRFTPTVAGYYLITGAANGSNTAYNYMNVGVWKNGSSYKVGCSYTQSVNYPSAIVSALVYLNGSTDYVEIYVLQNITASVLAGTDSTYFQASMIRSA